MSFELLNTLVTFGTFIVISATALAAIVQLRHMRSSNQIAALDEIQASQQAPEYVEALHFVYGNLRSKMEDPAFRYQIAHRTARSSENAKLISRAELVGDSFETIGVFAKTALVDRDLLLDIHAVPVVEAWKALADVTAVLRALPTGATIYENFEYLTVLSQDWIATHPDGSYPRNVRRIDLSYTWRSVDEQYAASLTR